jgi:Uma2 family endonuclease
VPLLAANSLFQNLCQFAESADCEAFEKRALGDFPYFRSLNHCATMPDTLAAVLKDPKAPLVLEQAQALLAEEARRRREFREWVTEEIKAEFIQGEIVLHSPVKRKHRIASELLFRFLSLFSSIKKIGEAAHEKAMVALTRNDYEPDICFWSKEKTAAFDGETMLHPAPDFVVEVLSKRISRHDRHTKFQDYALHGVREYWIIDPTKQVVEQYALLTENDTAYLPYGKFVPGEDITSVAIPGFTIPVVAIFEESANLEAIQALMKNG